MSFTHPWYLLLAIPAAVLLVLTYPRIGGIARGRKRLVFAIRALMLLALVMGIAGPQSKRPNRGLAVIFLLDRSDSVRDADKTAAEDFARQSIAELGFDDVAEVICFGKEPVFEATCAGKRNLPPIQSKVDGSGSDLSSALRLASAAFPDGKGRRIVVLSDGNETLGDYLEAADAIGRDGIEVSFVSPPKKAAVADAAVTEFRIPDRVRASQPFEVRLGISATQTMHGEIQLDRDGLLVQRQPVVVQSGVNTVVLTDKIAASGFTKYTATFVSSEDADARNNFASGFAVVRTKPKLLLMQQDPSHSELATALSRSGIDVELAGPGKFPSKPEALQRYDCILFNDFNAASLLEPQMQQLQAAVRDSGLAFGMIGGENSFLSGGYYNTPIAETLPVDLNVRQRKTFPSTSVLIIVDCSGSMGELEDGVVKLRLAARAAEETVKLLSPQDRVGVYGSSDGIEHVAEMQSLSNKEGVIDQIRHLDVSGGGIYIGPSVQAAEPTLRNEESKVRHLIILADGSDSTDWRDSFERVAAMLQSKITTSVVAIGDGPDVPELKKLAATGGGQFYLAARASQLPAIFTQDTSIMSRSAIEEGEFFPKQSAYTEALKGIDAMPSLYAYCLTDGRTLAKVSLRTPKDDPLYATWQYGLGKTLAFTSDAQNRWAANWVSWPGFAAFWSQAARSILREASDNSVIANTESNNGKTTLKLEIQDSLGNPVMNFGGTVTVSRPDGSSLPVAIVQRAPGQFEGPLDADAVGTYVVAVAENGSSSSPKVTTSGFTVSYPAEYRGTQPNVALLKAGSKLASGREISQPKGALTPLKQPGFSITDLWMAFMLLSGLLLPLDVAVRRIVLPMSEMVQIAVSKLRRSARSPGNEMAIDRLKLAKTRASQPDPASHLEKPIFVESKSEARPPTQVAPGSSAQSLIEAKRRRKERGQDERG